MLYNLKMLIVLIALPQLLLAQKTVEKSKPNIIYIYADDLGYGEIGSYGQKLIKTPNLDKMAKEGMKFTDHYTSTPDGSTKRPIYHCRACKTKRVCYGTYGQMGLGNEQY